MAFITYGITEKILKTKRNNLTNTYATSLYRKRLIDQLLKQSTLSSGLLQNEVPGEYPIQNVNLAEKATFKDQLYMI